MNGGKLGTGPTPSLEGPNAGERVAHIKGRVEGYDTRIRKVIKGILGDAPLPSELEERVYIAFLREVEDDLAHNFGGGTPFNHLVQTITPGHDFDGKGVVSPETYRALREQALALAATFAVEANEQEYARAIFEELGRVSAARLLSTEG